MASSDPSRKGSGRIDRVWNHCVSIDRKARNVKCKYCEKVLSGGIYQLEHHLAGTSKDVGACIVVSKDVKRIMLDMVSVL